MEEEGGGGGGVSGAGTARATECRSGMGLYPVRSATAMSHCRVLWKGSCEASASGTSRLEVQGKGKGCFQAVAVGKGTLLRLG